MSHSNRAFIIADILPVSCMRKVRVTWPYTTFRSAIVIDGEHFQPNQITDNLNATSFKPIQTILGILWFWEEISVSCY